MAFKQDIINELLLGAKTKEDLFGAEGLLKQLSKQ